MTFHLSKILEFFFRNDMKVAIEVTEKMMVQRKFLQTPIAPPILVAIVFSEIWN